jgi:Protein of unknown function (DUF3617)
MKKLPICAVAVVCLVGFAAALDVPPMREGLWSIRTQTIDNPGNVKSDFTQKICRNHAYDQAAQAKARNVPGCKVLNENLSGHAYTIEMECKIAGSVIRSKGVTTRTADGAAHSETHATYAPALNGVSDMTMIMDQKYLGSCPSGIQPGDIIRADGTILHTGKR